MNPYWVTFVDGKSVTCYGRDSFDARIKATEIWKKGVVEANLLPFPALPITKGIRIGDRTCSQPGRCQGHNRCQGNCE